MADIFRHDVGMPPVLSPLYYIPSERPQRGLNAGRAIFRPGLISLSLLATVACDADMLDSANNNASGQEAERASAVELPLGATFVVSSGHAMDFVYSHDEMFGFDIEAYLRDNAPHLVGHAETISHFAGKEGISPRLLIALIEQQSQALSRVRSDVLRPFGELSNKSGFIAQTRDVTARLTEARYDLVITWS